MLRGNVDRVTRASVSGWAAREDSPDGAVDVSIYIDGGKVAQIKCTSPRPDLKQLGIFGDGAHGFRFEFSDPVEADADRRVTVRFSDGGKLLGNGDVLIRRDGTTSVRVRTDHRLIGEPEPLPAPRDPRSLFETLTLLDHNAGVHELIARLGFENMTREHVHCAVFGDYPVKKTTDDTRLGSYSAHEDMNHLLLSDDFQRNLIPLLLRAFPEKKRLIFVHVPKCAGTDLSANLMKKIPFLHEQMTQSIWMGKEDLLRSISRLVLHLRFFDQIFVAGHNSLGYYASRGLIRPIDKVFTILRDPIQIAISQVNYVMTRLHGDLRTGKFGPDTREWLNVLDMESLPLSIPPAMVQNLCSAILRNRRIVQPNSMCFWLAGGDAEAAIGELADSGVEITTTENYNDWLQQNWGILTLTRLNRSDPFISTETISHQDLLYLQEAYSEDIRLYAKICQILQQSGKLSVSGKDLRQ
jgi:hypothetical protein